MRTIRNNIENTIIINKSKFITKLFYVNSINEINNILKNTTNDFDDSSHVCYAYILDEKEKCSDNKEPSGTAGMPMLNVLKKNSLNHILAVVIRYFGGIKLGAGGLVRAYSTSITQALNLTDIIELTEGYLVELEFNYDQLKLVDYMLSNKKIVNKNYSHNIIYKFYLSGEQLDFIPKLEQVAIHVSIKDKTYIPKKECEKDEY